MANGRVRKLQSLARTMRRELDTDLAALREKGDQHFVFGKGDPDAQVVFVGEAPGRREAETGEPFVGAAGKLLDVLLKGIGRERQSVYITNVVKDRPPRNRRPRSGEIEAYKPYLLTQLKIIKPEVIVPLGLVSTRVLMDEFVGTSGLIRMKDVHGREYTGEADWGQMILLPMYHPAASFYGSLSKADLEHDFQVLQTLLRGGNLPA